MTKKTIFTVDGSTVSKTIDNVISFIKKTRVKVVTKENKKVANLPLFWALLLGIIFPVLTVAAAIIMLVLSYKISVERENNTDSFLIDNK
jgi:predicted membrane protein